MSDPTEDVDRLAQELLGRNTDELDEEEQRVLARVAAGSYIGIDAAEAAQLNASFGDRLADRVARVGGSWAFIIGFGLVLLAGGAAAALTLVSSGLGAARCGALPKWLAWAGVVIGVLVFFIGGLFIPMALFVLWVLVTAIVMLTRTA